MVLFAVIVLGLMVWIVKRVRHTISSPPPNTGSLVESNLVEGTALTGGSMQILQQPTMMMACPLLEPTEYKQDLELNHYVIA